MPAAAGTKPRGCLMDAEKVVARFKDGRVLKGFVKDFRIDSEAVALTGPDGAGVRHVPVDELKALFFVKTFEGFDAYAEKKVFGIRKQHGCKVVVQFTDDEILIGIIEGELPWDKGFSLAKLGKNTRGFFLMPVDDHCNNNKVFVVGSAIQDITIMAA